jgi:hypothetical protein
LNNTAPHYQKNKNKSNTGIVDLTLDNKDNNDEYKNGRASHNQAQRQKKHKKPTNWTNPKKYTQKNSPLERVTNKNLQPRLSSHKPSKNTNSGHHTQSQHPKFLSLSVVNPLPPIQLIHPFIQQSLEQFLQLGATSTPTSYSSSTVQSTILPNPTKFFAPNKPFYQPSRHLEQKESRLQPLTQKLDKKKKKKSRRIFQRYVNRNNKLKLHKKRYSTKIETTTNYTSLFNKFWFLCRARRNNTRKLQ